MVTPDKIYLLDMGDEVDWADSPDPGVDMEPDDAIAYVKANKVLKVLKNILDAHNLSHIDWDAMREAQVLLDNFTDKGK